MKNGSFRPRLPIWTSFAPLRRMPKSSFVLRSPELQTDYVVFVDTPEDAASAPLVVVLDGDDQFGPAVEAARAVERNGSVSPLTLVGVGYGGGYRSPLNRRVRDYSPTQPKDESMESGGAEAFHRFLDAQLLPTVVDRLRIMPSSFGLTGHSLGSLFGLHALFRPRPIFTSFLISSPSIWWDDRAILSAVARSPSPALPPTRAFISVGETDTPSMTGDVTLLETELQRHPRAGLTLIVERFADRDHYNVLPDAFRQGLRWLYGSHP